MAWGRGRACVSTAPRCRPTHRWTPSSCASGPAAPTAPWWRYVPEPERGRRNWAGKPQEQRCGYANRQRVRAKRSKRLQKLRGELCERSFAHCYETGGMRRLYLRGSGNALKRVLVHAAAFNLGLLLRKLSRWGKPRQPQGRLNPLQVLLFAVFAVYDVCRAVCRWFGRFPSQPFPEATAWHRPTWFLKRSFSATAC